MPKINKVIEYYEFKNDPNLYTVNALKKTLKFHVNKVGSGNKSTLFEKVRIILDKESIKNMMYIPEITKIQSCIRSFLVRYQNNLCGFTTNITKNLNNDSDFLMCEHWKKNREFFFAYKDRDNFYYYFDIRSINKLIQSNQLKSLNPYNRHKIPFYIINRINKRMKWLKRNNISVIIQDDSPTNNNTVSGLKRIISDIFIEISRHGYNVDINWFNKLNIHKCKMLYNYLEDIWNYRTALSIDSKRRIAPPNGLLFSVSPNNISHLVDIFSVHKILINNVKRLILDGITEEDRRMGMMYFIIALSEVSQECLDANPWALITLP